MFPSFSISPFHMFLLVAGVFMVGAVVLFVLACREVRPTPRPYQFDGSSPFPPSQANNERSIGTGAKFWTPGEFIEHMKNNRAQRGFSLLELLIVVAIMLTIAAIAIPSFAKAKRASNEASAVQTLKGFLSAEGTYVSQYNNGYGSPAQLAGIASPDTCDSAGLLPVYMAGTTWSQSGYDYVFTPTGSAWAPQPASCATVGTVGFTVAATPHVVGQTGLRSFFIDESGVLRYDPTGAVATIASVPLGQ